MWPAEMSVLVNVPPCGECVVESASCKLNATGPVSGRGNAGAVGESRRASDGSKAMVIAALDDVLGGGTIGESGERGDLGPGSEKFSTDRA